MQNLTSPQLRQAFDALTTAMRQNPENAQMILLMNELDPSMLSQSRDGIEALIRALIQKYSKK